MDLISLVFSVLCFCTLWNSGCSLECYTCESSKIASKSGGSASFLQKLTGKVVDNPACDEAGLEHLGSIPTKSCRPNEVCSDVRASFTVGEQLTGSEVTVESVVRGCMQGSSLAFGGSCSHDVNTVKDATNSVLNLLNDIPLVSVKVDGEVCSCSTDLCSAGRCAEDSVKIAGYCVKILYLGVVGGGLALLILLCICCCCCCCGCCKKKQNGIIIQPAFPQGGVLMGNGQVPYVRFDGNQASQIA